MKASDAGNKCSKCARWTSPRKESACYMSEEINEEESVNIEFIKNQDGTYGCADFVPVLS